MVEVFKSQGFLKVQMRLTGGIHDNRSVADLLSLSHAPWFYKYFEVWSVHQQPFYQYTTDLFLQCEMLKIASMFLWVELDGR